MRLRGGLSGTSAGRLSSAYNVVVVVVVVAGRTQAEIESPLARIRARTTGPEVVPTR